MAPKLESIKVAKQRKVFVSRAVEIWQNGNKLIGKINFPGWPWKEYAHIQLENQIFTFNEIRENELRNVFKTTTELKTEFKSTFTELQIITPYNSSSPQKHLEEMEGRIEVSASINTLQIIIALFLNESYLIHGAAD